MGRTESSAMSRKGGHKGHLDYVLFVCFSNSPELDTALVPTWPWACLRGAWQEQRLLVPVWGSRREGPESAGDEQAVPGA